MKSSVHILGTIFASTLGVTAGCTHQAHVAPIGRASQPPLAAAPPKTVATSVASANLAVSDELAQRCKLQLDNLQQAPKFDFDRFQLLPADRTVLEQVAACVTTGPLKGRTLELIGRADPRGTEEYNISLGQRRAASVGSYLEHLGVGNPQISETSFGATGATGTDETAWRVDRRVDVDLFPN